jgi:hypothetical protein
LGFGKTEIFLQRGLDIGKVAGATDPLICPSGKSVNGSRHVAVGSSTDARFGRREYRGSVPQHERRE